MMLDLDPLEGAKETIERLEEKLHRLKEKIQSELDWWYERNRFLERRIVELTDETELLSAQIKSLREENLELNVRVKELLQDPKNLRPMEEKDCDLSKELQVGDKIAFVDLQWTICEDDLCKPAEQIYTELVMHYLDMNCTLGRGVYVVRTSEVKNVIVMHTPVKIKVEYGV